MMDAGSVPDAIVNGSSGGAGGNAGDDTTSTPQAGAPEEPPEVIVECTAEDTRPCSEAGLEGACALGTQTCSEEGLWGECSIQPEGEDTCDPGNDANCNGVPNEGCGCVEGAQRSCSVGGALGNCAAGTEVCASDGSWDDCDVQPADEDSCDIIGDDADCDGVPNGNCDCTAGDVLPCGPPTDDGICEFGESQCVDGMPGECQNAVYAGSRDCTSSADNDCDGVPDNTLDDICKCEPGSTQSCGEHPGLDGNGPCKAGQQTCQAGPGNLTSNWSPTCVGSVGPSSQDLCNTEGDDSNCDGEPNGNCACIAGDRTTCGDEHDSLGDCTSIMLTCRQNGTYPGTSACQASSAELCNNNNRDEDCDGQINESPPCDCTNGQTQPCGNCDLGTESCEGGLWQACEGDDLSDQRCGCQELNCAQPTTRGHCTSSTSNGQCTCSGVDSLTSLNSSCNVGGVPVCGAWTFATGTTEGVVIDNGLGSGASTGAPSVSSMYAVDGGSLAIGVNADGNTSSGGRSLVVVRFDLCPGGTSLNLSSCTLTVNFRAQRSGPNIDPQDTDSFFTNWNGTQSGVGNGCDFQFDDNSGESAVCSSLPSQVTDVGVLFRFEAAWTGTIYIDDVTLDC